ncbi:MAG TPA: D-alanyl-D-alanine carboxypeptidase [Microbacteriaceae bacterium]|nr:D-alanyl-D-alanine carboxypeptidase [Microbacteriaceae bacterium]
MPRHGREVYVRRRIAVGIVAVLGLGAIGVGGYSAVALGLPLPETVPVAAAPALPAGPEVAPAPAAYGSSGIGALGWDGPLVVAGDAGPRPIASISKVVTALVVLDRLPLDDGDGPLRELTAQDAEYYSDALAEGESRVFAEEGSVISERDALEAMLVSSSGNHARMLVDWAFGSQDAFPAAAAEWLAANGLTGTTILEPTGVDPGNTSTIPDLIRIGELALANPVTAGIVAQGSAHLPDVGEITSSNALLGIDGIDGIKTGTLDEAGACLLFSADATIGGQTVTLVGAVLGGPDHDTVNDSVRTLLASAVAGFQELSVPAGTDFGDYTTRWDASADAVSAEDATFLVWGPERLAVEIDLDPVVTGESGLRVGTATLSSPRETRTVPLVLGSSLPDPGAEWRWANPGR